MDFSMIDLVFLCFCIAVVNMSFNDFHGNSDVVHRLREMLAAIAFPRQ